MLYNYFKIAIKVLMRRKFFTFISLFGISFTLIVLMVVAAIMENAISAVKPESNAHHCLTISRLRFGSTAKPTWNWSSSPGYKFMQEHVLKLPFAEKISLHSRPRRVLAFVGGRKLDLNLKTTDGNFWEIMDFHFLEGSGYIPAQADSGAFVAVINQATRDGYFGGESALGRKITVDGQSFTVQGVVANVPVYRRSPFSDVWVPIKTAKTSNYQHELMGEFNATILAKSRADFPKIKQALQDELPKVAFPDPKNWNIAYSMADTMIERWSRVFTHERGEDAGVAGLVTKIMGLALLFMLLPAVNLINLNSSRILERSSEIGIRKAFGATSRNLATQFLTENLVLTGIGGLLGFLGAALTLRFISQSGVIPYADFQLNLTVFWVGLLTTFLFGVLSGVYPAWRMSRLHPVAALKGGSQ